MFKNLVKTLIKSQGVEDTVRVTDEGQPK